MKITKIEKGFFLAHGRVYVEDLDEQRVYGAYNNPEISELAKEHSLVVSNPNGLVFFRGSEPVCGINVPNRYIFLYPEYQKLVEKVSKLVLGESLNEAILNFKKSSKGKDDERRKP
jgi:hypothetical protein